jgi:hypothetical protein
MDRREFLKTMGTVTAAAAVAPLIPFGAVDAAESFKRSNSTSRYVIHGSKKLGCSGFDFPDDPTIIDTGLFMPSL